MLFLVDATYELFRAWFSSPPRKAPDGREVGAVRGVLASLIVMLRDEGATHVACATDHIVESFRNRLYAGYKTGDGIDPDLFGQFAIVEEAMRALGLVVWPMIEFEADDALAAGAALFAKDAEKVMIATVDKDLAQSVRQDQVVMVDRRRKTVMNQAGVKEKFGVEPDQIADYLALVGDTADGYPGIKGFGAKSAAAVLQEYGHIEKIPADASLWKANLRGKDKLARTLAEQLGDALLFKQLATLRTDVPIKEKYDDLLYRGPRADFEEYLGSLGMPDLASRVAPR